MIILLTINLLCTCYIPTYSSTSFLVHVLYFLWIPDLDSDSSNHAISVESNIADLWFHAGHCEGQLSALHAKRLEGVFGEWTDQVFSLRQQHIHQGKLLDCLLLTALLHIIHERTLSASFITFLLSWSAFSNLYINTWHHVM